MGYLKKPNFSDPQIKIRILKALGDIKPVGLNKHFLMIKILRNMKRPNVITGECIWTYLSENFSLEKIDEKEIMKVKKEWFEDVFVNNHEDMK